MESYRTRYIAILNKFKNGEMHLSRHEVFAYLAAIKLNMILWDKRRIIHEVKHGNIDLVDLDNTKVAKINLRDNISRIIMPAFNRSSKIHKFILICETNISIDDNFMDYEIIRLDYDEELSKVPMNPVTVYDPNGLVLIGDSQVLYKPRTGEFIENKILRDTKNINVIDGILTVRNHNSMIIVAPNKYYNELMMVARWTFDDFRVKCKKNMVKIKGNKIDEWRELLELIRDYLK